MIDKVVRQTVTSALGVAEFLLSRSLDAVRLVNDVLADSGADDGLTSGFEVRTERRERGPSWRPADLGDLDATAAVLRDRARRPEPTVVTRAFAGRDPFAGGDTTEPTAVSGGSRGDDGAAPRRRPPRAAMRRPRVEAGDTAAVDTVETDPVDVVARASDSATGPSADDAHPAPEATTRKRPAAARATRPAAAPQPPAERTNTKPDATKPDATKRAPTKRAPTKRVPTKRATTARASTKRATTARASSRLPADAAPDLPSRSDG